MKQLLFFITITFLTIHSFGQFADTTALNNYIRDTIKDRRPDKITTAQLQKALLGTTKLLNTGANFSNSDLLFSGNRTHNGNQKSLWLNNFSSIRWKTNNIDSTMGAEWSINSSGDMFNIGKTSYNSFQSNASGDPYWYLDTRDPSTNHAGLMYASPMTVQLASTGSALANSIIAMYNDSVFLAATDGEVHGDSILQGYSKIAGNSNYRLVTAVRDGSLQFIKNEDHIGLDTAYRSIEQKDISSLSLLRRTSFNQNRSGFTFTSSGSSNPNLLFYAENLPGTTDTTTYKPLGYNPANGQFVKFNGWSDVVNGGNFWKVTGNTGTNPSSHFIGTTDAQDLALKTDNTLRALFTYDGRFKVGNEGFKNAGRQAVFIDSINAANVLSIENPQAGFSSDEVLSLFQNFNNYADIVKYNSSYSDTYLNTSIPFAGSLSIGVRYNGADYGAPIIGSGSSLITIPSTTGTDFGIKADKFGLRIDKINALHTTNGPRILYVNGSIGANKDSITRQTATGTRQMLVIDTTTGKFERMTIGTNVGSSIAGGTNGSILFVDGSGNLGQNNTKFFWDNTNEFLGIGTGTPSSPLHVKDILTGSDATTTAYINPIWNTTGDPIAFLVNPLVIANGGASLLADFRYSGSSRFKIRHDGSISIGNAPFTSKLNLNATTTENYITLTTPGNFGGDPVDVKYSIKPINGLYGDDPFSRGGLQFKNESTLGGDSSNGVFSFDGSLGVKVIPTSASQLLIAGTRQGKRLLDIDSTVQTIGDRDSLASGYSLRVDQSNGRILLGDVAGISNGVRMKMDNSDQEITFSKYGTTKFTFKTSDGGARFDTYGSGTHTGTAATVPYFDASGNIIEKSLPQYFAQTATVSVSGTNDETTLVGSGVGSLTIPSSAWHVGKTYRVTIAGRYTSDADNPMSLHPRLKLGSVVIAEKNTFIGSSQDEQWRVVVEFTCRSTGSSGTIITFGTLWNQNSVNEFSNGTSTSTINMTTNQTIDVTGILSDDSPGNSISAYMIILEEVN